MSQHRANITIDPHLHATAKTHARRAHGTDFSGLVTKLIIADLGDAYLKTQLSPSKASETVSMIKRVMKEEELRLPHGPRAAKSASYESIPHGTNPSLNEDATERDAKKVLKHAKAAASAKSTGAARRKPRAAQARTNADRA